ncbi:MAG: putative Ig protein [Frankiales bacterium]|nr:putative Ig protein [Frankiales bacterium]
MKDLAFHAAGKQRWTLGATMTRSLQSHRFWNLGVMIGHKLLTVRIRVV